MGWDRVLFLDRHVCGLERNPHLQFDLEHQRCYIHKLVHVWSHKCVLVPSQLEAEAQLA